MLLFSHNATRNSDKYISKYKLKALEKFNEWNPVREKESEKQVKQFRTDGGGEYTFMTFTEYLQSEGIPKKTTMPYTPQSNGVVKWANCMIMERLQTMPDHATLSKNCWAFAWSPVVDLRNPTPMRSGVGPTPYKARHRRKPFLNHLHVISCFAFVRILKEK